MKKLLGAMGGYAFAFALAIVAGIPATTVSYTDESGYSASMTLSQTSEAAALSNAEENSFIDWYMRAQAKTAPATIYIALETVAGSDTACGTEVSTANWTTYARVAVTSSLANWAGTQAAASTVASSGTGGTTSNNAAITFPTPQTTGGTTVTVVGFCAMSAASAGTMLFRATLTGNRNVATNDPAPAFAPAALTFQIDN